ncbi:MAG: NUDIX domain-containing protein, partial [Nitrospira defluvii]|nr:NUDIX domain-containing protein [Nitrospira defluvii]
ALVVLVVVGILTLMRLLIRNTHTDECKRDLDHIRQVFKDCFDGDGLLLGYYPVRGVRQETKSKRHGVTRTKEKSILSVRTMLPETRVRSFGGLTHLMAALNSLLLAIAVFLLFLPVPSAGKFEIHSAEILPASVAAILVFMAGFLLQWLYVVRREVIRNDGSTLSIPTHAGGVVYKNEGEETLYLIISTKDNQQNTWVLPKGHIESGEGNDEAALREVEEEAGVVAQLMWPLGEVSFLVMSGEAEIRTRAKFYLMGWLFDMPEERSENRVLQWLPFEQALKQLTFPEAKRMLLLAHAKSPR